MFPERDSFVFFGHVFPDFLWFLCIMVVLGASAAQLGRLSNPGRSRWWMTPLVGIGAAIIGLLIFPSKMLVHYLVYVAMSGVEKSQATRWQRPGAYSHHEAEGFWFYGIAWCAVLAALLGGALLIYLLNARTMRLRNKVLVGIATTGLLSTALCYSVWYYGWGLPREAPDFVEAGTCGTWIDWWGAGAMVAIVLTIAAYRCATEKPSYQDASNPELVANPMLYESLLVLPFFLGSVLLYYLDLVRSMILTTQTYRIADVVEYVLTDSGTLIFAALTCVILQFAWRRWKQGMTPVYVKLIAVNGREFTWAWISLAVLTAILPLPLFLSPAGWDRGTYGRRSRIRILPAEDERAE